MAYTLAEAIWLVRAGVTDDVLVGYPTADRAALAELAADPTWPRPITLMVDSAEQLDLIDAVVARRRRPELRVCLELDASWRPLRRRTSGCGARRVHSARRRPARSPRRSPAGPGSGWSG